MRQSGEPALDGLPAVETQGDTARRVGKDGKAADGHGTDEQGDERRHWADPPEAQPGDEPDGDGSQQRPEHLGPEWVDRRGAVLSAEVAAQEEGVDDCAQRDGDGRRQRDAGSPQVPAEDDVAGHVGCYDAQTDEQRCHRVLEGIEDLGQDGVYRLEHEAQGIHLDTGGRDGGRGGVESPSLEQQTGDGCCQDDDAHGRRDDDVGEKGYGAPYLVVHGMQG